jgi:hypothetical protein
LLQFVGDLLEVADGSAKPVELRHDERVPSRR